MWVWYNISRPRSLDVRQGLEIVIGDPQQRVLEIGQVTLHVDREDLSAAIARRLVPDRKSGNHQARALRLVAFPNDILLGPQSDHAIRKREQRLLILFGQSAPQLKLGHHRMES
jgi:hypothetical protein